MYQVKHSVWKNVEITVWGSKYIFTWDSIHELSESQVSNLKVCIPYLTFTKVQQVSDILSETVVEPVKHTWSLDKIKAWIFGI